ncbi:hypothetical protein Tco_1257077 [Tanacetum coccineum]
MKQTYKNDTADDAAGETPVQKPASENEQTLKNVLDKIIDQDKEATEQSDAGRKEFEAQYNRQHVSGKSTRASSTNSFNTDQLMPDLEDTADVLNIGNFGSAFDDEDLDTYNSPFVDQVMDVEADFNNMEPSTVQKANGYKVVVSEIRKMKRCDVKSVFTLWILLKRRTTSTPMETNKALTKDEDGEDVDGRLMVFKYNGVYTSAIWIEVGMDYNCSRRKKTQRGGATWPLRTDGAWLEEKEGCSSCRDPQTKEKIHTLFMDGTPMEINMLVEKKYPLIKELLEKMLNLQLEAEEESTMAFELIKLIKSMLKE